MKKAFMVLLCLILFGCSSNQVSNETSNDNPTVTSETPVVESEEPIESEVTSLDDVYIEPFYTTSGSGDDVVTDLVTDGAVILDITNVGPSNFTVWAYDEDDNRDLLVNEIGNYEGSVLLLASGKIMLEVGSSGDWTIAARKASTQSSDVIVASGDYVTPVFICSSDIYDIKATGDGNIAIWVYKEDGSRDLLVNEIDDYEGTVLIRAKDEMVFLAISGNEFEYSITPSDK